MPTPVSIDHVRLEAGIFRRRMELDRAYLKELDTDALLQNFHHEAGINVKGIQVLSDPESAGLHWGWESPTCQLRGHFLGHWMSACAKLIASEDNRELRYKLEYVVDELERCQMRNGGEWVGSIPEKFLDFLGSDEYVWSPQYTMHKTLMGLIDTYRYTGNKKALAIADRLGDWYIKWVKKWSEKCSHITYKGEQGGMLELWAELFEITGDDKYKTLIDRYKDSGMYTQLENGRDALTDDHANASIPLSHGADMMYRVTGDERWVRITDLFWKNAVDDRGMFATTGSNAGEFWIPPKSHAMYISDSDQEFCTVYNMVRTADMLYQRTGDTRYADYIERALYNGFLAQQNRETGMPTYFLPLRAGGKKKWGSRTRDFWCCHGTMVQAQTIYPELIYYTDPDGISVMQYIPSTAELEYGKARVKLSQTTDMKNYNNQVFFDEQGGGEKSRWSLRLNVSCDSECEFTLRLRMPEWSSGVRLLIDGSECEYAVRDGCIVLSRVWKDSSIFLMFESKPRFEKLEGGDELYALLDGPVVLAGLIDRDTGLYGSTAEEILTPRTEHTYGTYVWKQSCFVTKGQPTNIEFIPLYDVTDEEYTVYFTRK